MKLACREVNSGECDFVAEGLNPGEVKRKIYGHERAQHPQMLEKLTDNYLESKEKRMNELIAIQQLQLEVFYEAED
ncbi:MAG: hypothetical protein EPN86_05250 [Nanoarchaeota archaeon]|nr:MAG: hypothetical protein EPN86_05250 [Nanoarchaeota archaeon]